MDIRVLNDETTFRLKDFFNDLSTKLSKNSTNQILHSHILEKIYSLITEYSERTMDGRILLAELLNLYAQVDISKAGLLMDQIEAPFCFGLYGLQTNFTINCVASKCFISYCNIETLRLRYKDFEDLKYQVEIKKLRY